MLLKLSSPSGYFSTSRLIPLMALLSLDKVLSIKDEIRTTAETPYHGHIPGIVLTPAGRNGYITCLD